ncbi:unnamed protein product [Toxocara canis]|uniref:Syntaxin-18 n=1 Tax=Toxocara canis TaxID=6265 RepID=A0A183UQR7_TOXCA|nr:unnamed protein product [Toxocara canis]
MCEWERNELDDESERAIRQCSQLIRSFERQIRSDTQLRASDEAAHLEGVARILESYLRKIAKIITELRSVRVRKTAEMKKMIRLSTLVQIHKNKLRNEALAHEDESNGDENQTKLDRFHRETSSNSVPLPQESTSGLRKRRSGEKGDVNRTTKEEQSEVAPFVEGYRLAEDRWEQIPASTDEPLSEEERVQMVAENEKLYAKLAQVDSDILRIEKQMNQIHRLQETFAEKVLDQERDINFVSETTVHSVENIREGNEQIRQAIQNMASRRVILLFCIIVLTFTLLFLDWYNP